MVLRLGSQGNLHSWDEFNSEQLEKHTRLYQLHLIETSIDLVRQCDQSYCLAKMEQRYCLLSPEKYCFLLSTHKVYHHNHYWPTLMEMAQMIC